MKIFKGTVISKNSEKTATVIVERFVSHPLYGKKFRRNKKYHVHDETETKVGQKVSFIASRPYSKTKKWKIVEILSGESSERDYKKRNTKGVVSKGNKEGK